ncbi:MAG: BatA domain-containing protein [Planctomyces sp.]|nr:BatA domain-containing protein [Planctomyces sp.]
MSFLAPWLLYATVLASAPIIIHLLNRRRFLRVDWAPMKYLKLTLKANRRRLRIEQWILLAVRTLAVAALIFAVARPVSSTTDLAGFLRLQGRASRVIVIDDSLSMTHSSGGVSAFGRALQAAEQVLRALGPQDSLTVCTTSRPRSPFVRHAQLDSPDQVVAQVLALTPSDVASHWASTFAAADEHLQSSVFPIREVIVVTDLWSSGWGPDMVDLADRWATDGVTLRIVDVGLDPSENRRILSFAQADPVALVDTEVRFLAEIRNDGREAMLSEQALVSVNDVVQSVTLPDIPPGETVEAPLTLTFDEPGQHQLRLQLPQDSVPGDNERFLTVDVRRQVEVTLVDGDPGVKPFDSETDFLALALTAGNSQWKAQQVISSDWIGQPLEAPDVLVLANVDQIPPERAAELEALVQAGMGVLIFAGDEVDSQAWNEALHRDGRGLLPARIEQVREAESTGLIVEPLADSPLAALQRIAPEALARIRPRRVLEVALPADLPEHVRVLARWNDSKQTPALLEKRLGLGRVLFWTVTADRAWSDWPIEPSFVLSTRLAAQAVAARVSRWENLICGQPLRFPLDAQTLPQSVSIDRAGSPEPLEAVIDRAAAEGPEFLLPSTRLAGAYEATWDEPGLGARSRQFAVSPDARDSEPERVRESDLPRYLGQLIPKMLRFTGESLSLASEGTELWRSLAFAMIGLLLFESLFATWIGRVR